MADPLSDFVTLLQPAAGLFKVSTGAGRWRVRREDASGPFYSAVLEGACCLTIDGGEPVTIEASDFVLIPESNGFTVTSLVPPDDARVIQMPDGSYRLGDPDAPPDVHQLIGYCEFESPDADVLVSLLPRFVHIRGEPRLATLVGLVGEETRDARPAREVVLARLLEVLFIEALRSGGIAGTRA